MLIELYLFYQAVTLLAFYLGYNYKNYTMWGVTLLLTGMMMFLSYYVEKTVYVYNATLGAYEVSTVYYTMPYLAAINFLFFSVALLYMMYDIWENYALMKGVSNTRNNDRETL